MEVQVPRRDVAVLRTLSKMLRDTETADVTRDNLRKIAPSDTTVTAFKDLLMEMPNVTLEFRRSRGLPRAVDID